MRTEDFDTPVDQLPKVSPPVVELSNAEDWDAPTFEDFKRLASKVWPGAKFSCDDDYWHCNPSATDPFSVCIYHAEGCRYWEVDAGRSDSNVFKAFDTYVSQPTLPLALGVLRAKYLNQEEMARCAANRLRELVRRATP